MHTPKQIFVLLQVTLMFHFSCCLFEDQVGKFDWRQQYIGKVKFSHIDPAIAGSQKFAVATDENVLACLSTRTGSIIWRQVLEKGDLGNIDALSQHQNANDGNIITVSGKGKYIRSWDSNNGVLQWETSFPQKLEKDSKVFFEINVATKEIIRVEIFSELKVQVSIYGYIRGSLKKSEVTSVPWYNDKTKCAFISDLFFICVDGNQFQLLSLSDGGASFRPLNYQFQKSGKTINDNVKEVVPLLYQLSSDNPYFVILIDTVAFLLQVVKSNINLVRTLPDVNAITSTIIDEKLVIFSISQAENAYKFKASDLSSGTELENLEGTFISSEKRGKLQGFFVLPFVKKYQGVGYKTLFLFEDHSIVTVHQNGKVVWSREEALASILSSEMIDLPLSETDASIEQEFGQPDAGVMSMFLTRLKSQVYLLQNFLLKVLIGLNSDRENMDNSDKTLTRDNFGLHKIIVILTYPGKLFGIDNLSGLIMWSHFENGFSPFLQINEHTFSLFVQRTTAHFPFPPVCTAIGQQPDTKNGRIFSFDPITGRSIESKTLSYAIVQTMPGGSFGNYLREIILLDSNSHVHVYPEPHDITKYTHNYFVFTAGPHSGSIVGFNLANHDTDQNVLVASKVWRVKLPNGVTKVVTKNPHEHVHSQGRVMGDRSVLYKYLNPNLVAVFTDGTDSTGKTFCNVYLIDAVTGLVVYSASHKRCRQPLHAVHSENWLIYSFFNDKSRRTEISSIELFEGTTQSNTTAFSSFSPPPLPIVEHQTFIFPSPVVALTDTSTERGLTNKQLLIALPSGGILELPKTYVDPRRPIHPLPEHREEGLIPYIPELPIIPEGIINYNRSVMNVRGITTSPSALESTCLVFVYGLDLFYTRVNPSKNFDILKDDFDHYLISVVLLGLLAISYTTKKLASRKILRAAWK